MTPGTSRSFEYTLPAQSLADLERELASMRNEMAALHERAARTSAVQTASKDNADEVLLQEAATLRAESSELRNSLSEALRLLAEERKERLSDRTEAARRHKDLEIWAEDRIRSVEHLATESREGTAEIRTSVQEALQLGELSEMRTLGAVAEESRNRSLTFQREQHIREAVTAELETRFRKMLNEERASRFQESATMQDHLGRVEDNMATERTVSAKKMEEIGVRLEKVLKELETEKETRQVQLRELLNRQDTLRSNLTDGNREIREIEDGQTRQVSQVESVVAALSERVEQEIKSMRQGMLEIRQQLHAETAAREDSCNLIRTHLDGETKTRLEVVDRSSQLHEDLEIRLERNFRAMLHDERVSREEAVTLLEQRASALQQELNFEKAKIAAQGRDASQSIAQLKEAIFSETNARREEVDAALKNVQQVAGTVQQGTSGRDEIEQKMMQNVVALDAAVKQEAAARQSAAKKHAEGIAEARLLLSKESAAREELEARLAVRYDEERATLEDSMRRLQSTQSAMEASGLTPEKLKGMVEEERAGRQQALQHLEAVVAKSDSHVGEERSLREEQYALIGGRFSQMHGEMEDMRLALREALNRSEEIRSVQESMSHLRAERQAEASGTELSMKELKARLEQLQQAADARERATAQKIADLVVAVDAEAKQRATGDEDLLRKQSELKETLPPRLAAERHRTDEALAKLEEVLRLEGAAERQQWDQTLHGWEQRWQQLREAMDEALQHRLEQHSGMAVEVAKVTEGLLEEQRSRQKEQKVMSLDLRRLGQEAQEAVVSRRHVEEGFREQISELLKRQEQAKESQHKQDVSVTSMVEELRRSVSAEASAREMAFSQLQKDFQNDVLVKEELLSAANKSVQRVAAKVTEDLRMALRDETRDREELRGRLEQHVIDVREAFGEMKAQTDRREVQMSDHIRKTAEALDEDMHQRKERDQQVNEAFEELRRAVVSETSERRGAADGLVGRLQHIEAAVKEEVAAREETTRKFSRELVTSQAKLQEEKAIREDSLVKLEQAVAMQVASLEDAVHRDLRAKEDALAQALAPFQKSLKAEQAAREEEARHMAAKLQTLVTEQQSEREERSRLLRDVNVSLAKLQRMQAEEEDTRNQEHERLGGALESLQEAVRSLKQSGEETRQRSQEVADHLRSLISRESATRTTKFEAVDSAVREVRSLIATEAHQREAVVKSLSADIGVEAQARAEAAGRERRAIEEEVGRAIREHRKSREEEERKVQERLIEMQACLSEEREQRLEALRIERLKTEEVKEELQGQKKVLQRDLDKFAAASKRMEDLSAHAAKEMEARLQVLSKSCDDLRHELVSDMQRSVAAWCQLEGKVTELETAFRTEVRDRKELQAELRRSLDAEVSTREEAVAAERRARESSDAQLDEVCKVNLQEERAQRLLSMEDCHKDLAVIKERLAEDLARRDHEAAQHHFGLQKVETTLTDLQRDRSADLASVRENLDHFRGEVAEGHRALKEEVHKLDARCLADRATLEGTARIAREQAVNLETALQGVHEDVTREAEERSEALRRLEARLGDERRQLEATAASQLRAVEDRLRSAEESTRQKLQEESRKSKLSTDKLSAQMSAMLEDMDKARSLQPEWSKDFARSLAQLERQIGAEEVGRQQAAVALQRNLDAIQDGLHGEVKDRRQQVSAAIQEVQTLTRSMQIREEKSEALQQQLVTEVSDVRDRLSREVRARETALLQLENRTSSRADDQQGNGYANKAALPLANTSAVAAERWRQAEEELEKTRTGLAQLKTEASSLSKAFAGLDERCESVRVAVGAVQTNLAEVQQKQTKASEVEALVAQAREELRKESQERKAEGCQLSAQLIEHAERLEWAEQQRLKAENALLQDVMEAKSELKREMRDREDGHTKVVSQLREETTRREEALEREARLRLEGEERAAQALQTAIREERRLRVQAEMRLEGKALASKPGDDKIVGAIMDSSSEEQTRLKQQLSELQARVTSSEARQKTAEERTVSMLDAIMNGLMSNEAS